MAGAGEQANIALPMAAITDFCRRWQIVEFALFGSVLREDFAAESDVDVLVRYAPGTTHSLRDYLTMHDELERLLGRRVDIVNRESLERSANYIRRRAVLDAARTIYVA